jgi:hypothetical protein
MVSDHSKNEGRWNTEDHRIEQVAPVLNISFAYKHQSDWLYVGGKFNHKNGEKKIRVHEIFELDQKTRIFTVHSLLRLSKYS